jgi:hypothetical protein
MNVVVFSKDRAAQLDLLLSSMEHHDGLFAHNTVVLYACSNERHKAGYGAVMHRHPTVKFRRESSFTDDLIGAFDPLELHSMMLVDDCVFTGRLDQAQARACLSRADVLCYSPRLSPGHSYSYTLGRPVVKPIFTSSGPSFSWAWPGADAEFGYPFSVDGHVFRTRDLLAVLCGVANYTSPNTLEAAGASAAAQGAFPAFRSCTSMACPAKPCLVNNAENMVQSDYPNRHGGGDVGAVNERFMAGGRLSVEAFEGLDEGRCHVCYPLAWEGEPLKKGEE